jgi:hypothetical protein
MEYGTGSMSTYNYGNMMGYGNLYQDGTSGVLRCYNDLTGALEWTYGNGPSGGDNSSESLSSPYGTYPTALCAIGGGVVYLSSTEHTFTNPIYKGALYRAVNATTGQQLWTLSGAGSSVPVIADGYEVELNGYDMQVYSIGRGPSQTTVTAPGSGVTTATPVVISGTVMDVSAGTKQSTVAADFPSGVPCASDASMTQWMGYVYQQQAEPTDFTGVPVTVSVTDSNGNHYNIGTATTNENGFYSLAWTPIIPGNYTVTATFAGTDGYWPSSATAAFYASSPAPTAAPTAAPPSGLASTGTVELGVAVLAIVIIIIGAVLAVLMLRRKP